MVSFHIVVVGQDRRSGEDGVPPVSSPRRLRNLFATWRGAFKAIFLNVLGRATFEACVGLSSVFQPNGDPVGDNLFGNIPF